MRSSKAPTPIGRSGMPSSEGEAEVFGDVRKETAMSNEQAAPETKGVTVKLMAALDLGPEVEGMAGRQL
jgi:hypothetical protein